MNIEDAKLEVKSVLEQLRPGLGVQRVDLLEVITPGLWRLWEITPNDPLTVARAKVAHHLSTSISDIVPEDHRYIAMVCFNITDDARLFGLDFKSRCKETQYERGGNSHHGAQKIFDRYIVPALVAELAPKLATFARRAEESTFARQAGVNPRLKPLFESLVKGVDSENSLLSGMFLNPVALPVRWKPFESPGTNATGSDSGQGIATEINGPKEMAALFNRLSPRQLIVTGEAGSGKTIMALQMQRELLALRSDHDPIAVIFPLSSWNPVALSLHEWMWRRLGYEFNNLDRLMSAVVDEGLHRDFIRRHVVPILDGFDEMPRSLQDQAADALQIALSADSAAIVTCRTEAYTRSSFLPSASAVSLEPLALHDSRQYLMAVSNKWEAVFADQIDSTRSVSSALRTPLMVWLSSQVYRARQNDPTALLDFADHEAIESHLLGGLVAAAFSRAGATDSQRLTSGADAKDATRWLGFLAHSLLNIDRERERRDIAWTELIKLAPWRSVGLGVSLLMGAVFGLETKVSIPLGLGQIVSFMFGIWFGFGFGRVYSTMRSKDYASHGRTGLFSGIDPELSDHLVRLGFGMLCTLFAGGAAFAISMGLWWHGSITLHERMPQINTALTLLLCGVGAVACCVIGSVGGFAAFRKLSSDPKADEKYAAAMANSPAEAVRRDGIFAAQRTFLIGTAVTGAVTAAVLWLGMRGNIGIGLLCGWSGGLAGVFVFAAWPRYRFAHIWLVLAGKLPYKLMAFLDDAHAEGVIRQTAVAYEFRHDLLQRALANAYKEQVKARSLDR